MFKTLCKKLFQKPGSYLVLCYNKEQAIDLYTRLRSYLRTHTHCAYCGSPKNCYMHVYPSTYSNADTKIQFISIRSNAYIDTQAAHQGKTIAYTIVDEFLNEHEEKTVAG